ncbi:MAG TPA: ABC transporter permease, partial [Verrucomicrobiota bacterium]|nr:ABC transporter permease [Verrucomicrobiota bacterium]
MIARRVWHMIFKEFLQSLRDKRMRMIIFGVPVIQLLMFGYAVNTDVRNIALAVVDLDQSAESREFVSRFVCSGHFQVKGYLEHENRIREILDTAGAQAVLRINAGFGRAVNSGQTATAQLLVDGADSNTAGIILGYASKIVRRYSQVLMESRLARTQGVVTPLLKVELQSRAWHNENL